MTTPKLGLTELANGQANYLNANESLAALDQLVQGAAVDKDLNTPPGSPANGALYIVGGSPAGAWSGQGLNLAYWLTAVGAWRFVTRREGMLVHVNDEDRYYKYNGATWEPFQAWPEIVIESGTARTLSIADSDRYLRTTSAASVTITVPPASSVAWRAATEIHIERGGVGAVIIAAGSGVTINRLSGTEAEIIGQYGVATLKRVGTDVWTLFGALEPTP